MRFTTGFSLICAALMFAVFGFTLYWALYYNYEYDAVRLLDVYESSLIASVHFKFIITSLVCLLSFIAAGAFTGLTIARFLEHG